MDRLTRDQIAKIFDKKELNPGEVLELIEKELGIKIDPTLPKEEQIDQVYDIYTDTLDKLDKKKVEHKRKSKKKKSTSFSRKEYIVELISQNKYTKNELIKMTDEYFDYSPGKSSKSRVSRVIRELKHEGKFNMDKTTGITSIK